MMVARVSCQLGHSLRASHGNDGWQKSTQNRIRNNRQPPLQSKLSDIVSYLSHYGSNFIATQIKYAFEMMMNMPKWYLLCRSVLVGHHFSCGIFCNFKTANKKLFEMCLYLRVPVFSLAPSKIFADFVKRKRKINYPEWWTSERVYRLRIVWLMCLSDLRPTQNFMI